MDGITIRPLDFRLALKTSDDCIWNRRRPECAVFLNALGVHVPHFERYLVFALRKARSSTQDARLRKNMGGIIGQEAHHAHNYTQFSAALFQRYAALSGVDERAMRYFERHAQCDSDRRLLGFTAGYETFTFLAGLLLLDEFEDWFGSADPEVAAFWIWHQVEEVEHGCVAFDTYKHFYGDNELYRKWMIVVAMFVLARETVVAYRVMMVAEGWCNRPWFAIARARFCVSMLLRFARNALPAFRRSYHPRNHPLVTSRQNPVQQGWRRFSASGGNVLSFDRDKINEVIGWARRRSSDAQ
ncbi:metal-dependent hydrolase [Paraburkholderia unamae]|nr:metal-dependent hydrolase [Paraburkholderia unamae]